jgi:hypothetical protein
LAAALFLFLVFAAIPRAASLQLASTSESADVPTARAAASSLPALFVGSGSDVPVDIRIALEKTTVGENDVDDDPRISVYKPAPGQVSALLGTFRSSMSAEVPKFCLKKGTLALGGTIIIKAGSGTLEKRFECGPTQMLVRILTFDETGSPISDCQLR